MLVSASATGKNSEFTAVQNHPDSVPVSEYYLPSVPCTHWDSGIPARKTRASHAMEGVTFSFDAKAGERTHAATGHRNLGKFWDLDLKTPPASPPAGNATGSASETHRNSFALSRNSAPLRLV